LATLICKSQPLADSISKEDLDFCSSDISQIISCLKNKSKIPAGLSDLFNYLSLKADIEPEIEEIKEEFNNCLREIKSLRIKKKLNNISQEIKEAEEEKDLKKSEKLIKEFNYWAKQIS